MKKLFFGLLVAVAAFSFSAFTVQKEANQRAKIATGDVWVNTDNAGNYDQHSNPSAFNSNDCKESNEYICAFERTAVNPTEILPADMDATEINQAVLDGLLEPITTKKGIYDGDL